METKRAQGRGAPPPPRGGRLGRAALLRGAAAAACLVGTLAALRALDRAEKARVGRETAEAMALAHRRLGDAVTAELEAITLKGHNAGSTPRLVAALAGRVNAATLRDLFENEGWWAPFRAAFTTFQVVREDDRAELVLGPAGGFDARALALRARGAGGALAQLGAGGGAAHAVVAVPVSVPDSPKSPVLLLGRPFDGKALAGVAERAGRTVLLSDGGRVLLGAGAFAETTALKAAVGRERSSASYAPDPRRWGAVIVSVAPGLWLLGYVDTAAAAARTASTFAALKLGAGGVGTLLFILSLLGLRRALEAAATRAGLAEAPASIGRYVLLERLGAGGMAEVHLAVSLGESGFRRPCVVKRLRPELADNPIAIAQFADEATLASSLVHSNIVPIYDFGRQGGHHFLVQEYVPGRDVGRLVRALAERRRRLPPEVVAHVGLELLRALDYAHNKRDHDGRPMDIVHRDVSPENVMISLRGEVKLVDFGVMQAKDARAREQAAGALKGNLAFMAPEQARGEAVDRRADTFSAALFLYFCLTGEPLYGAPGGYDLLARASAGPGPEELAKLAALPAPWASLLARPLAPSPDRRPARAASLGDEIAPFAERGAERLAAIMRELFEEEVRHEQRKLATPSSSVGAPEPDAPLALIDGQTAERPA